MPIDPAYLSIRPAEIASPLQSIGAFMQLRGQASEIALRQQQIEQSRQQQQLVQAETEQKNRDLADQNTIQGLMKDPTVAPQIAKGDLSALNGKVQLKTQTALADTLSQAHQREATASEADLKNKSAALSLLEQGLTSFKMAADKGDLETVNSQLPGYISAKDADGTFKLAGIDPSKLKMRFDSADQVDQALAGVGMLKGVTDKALEIKGTQTKQALEEAQAREATAKAATEEYGLSLAKQGGGSVENPEASVASRIDPQKYPAEYKEALAAGKLAAAGADPRVIGSRAKAFAEAVDKVYEKIAPYSPGVLAGEKAKQAVLLPGEITKATTIKAAEIPLEMKMRQDTAASGEYEKSLANLSTAAADASRIHNLIQAAQGGNKAAPGVIPIAELRSYVNRVNSTELRAVSSSAGSWADKVEGFLKGATEGQPIPPDVLKATDELASLQLANAEAKHKGEVAAINQARGTQKAPKTAADLGFTPIAPSAKGMIRARDPQGKLHQAPAGTALPAGWKLEP